MINHAREVARYYRWLDRLEWIRVMRGETGNEAQPVHRALRDPDGGPSGPMVVHGIRCWWRGGFVNMRPR